MHTVPPFFLSARLPSAPHSLFCTPFISSLWQASYLVTIDIPEPYRGEGQMRHRRKWWLFFICGLSRPLFHQVSVCTFGEAKCFYWTSTHSRASWLQIGFTYLSVFSPPCSHLFCLPSLFASPSFPHPFPKKAISSVHWKREQKTARKIKSKFLSSVNAFISGF